MPHATTPLAEPTPAREVSPPPQYRLDEASNAQLADAARSLCIGDDRLDDPSWLGRLRSAGVALPVGARRFLSAFGYDSGATGTMVLSGVPTDPHPSPTPTVVGSIRCTPTVSSAALLLLAQGLGHPVAYVTQEIRLRAGEMAVVDNRIAVHGRTACRPRFDGTDRWLHRAFVQVDFRRSRHLRPDNGHVLEARP